jgi:menaquinone-dependent protoporphyrinogen oxidase
MTRLCMVYGTNEGQTAKIARHIADILASRGIAADVLDGRRLPPEFSLAEYAGAIVGASMHIGGYQTCIHDFVRQHRGELERMPSAFFSVSLTEAYPQPEQRARLDAYLTRFFDETGWHPKTVASFAGALAYTRYGLVKRLAMQHIARQVGAPTDPTRDVEYTDWSAVTRFAETFVAALLAQTPPRRVEHPIM